MISLTIDGQRIEVPKGTTLLEACRRFSITIPTLCYYQAIEPYGGCRLCLVEAGQGGRSRLTTACTAPAEEGLEVITDSPKITGARKMTMELLLARCPEVPEVRKMAAQMGVENTRFRKEEHQCILCGKCVRVCQELMGVGAIGLVNRGSEKKVATPFDRFSEICRTCGACAFVCPTGAITLDKISARIPKIRGSEFNMGLSERPNIYKPFPQAVPAMPAIDAENCLHFLTGDCGACAKFCPAGAVDFDQSPEEVTLEVGAVIASPGFETFDARLKGEYGYGRYPNVVTSLEFERILSASGPFVGHVQRLSDGREPARVAWIQCVGSRDAGLNQDYCSSVCCMAATKQAVIAKEHVPNLSPTIFFIDVRAQGKGFDRYYERAKKEQGVRYVRSLISRVAEHPKTHDLVISYIDETNSFQNEAFDLVILSVGLKPHSESRDLARTLNIQTDRFGFCQSPPFSALDTSQPGILVSGVFQNPKDIPETVTQASGAAGEAAALLSEVRGTQVTALTFPEERSVEGEEARIGVLVCHCGINIAGVVDVDRVTAYAKTLPNVVYADHFLFTCSTDTQERMQQVIKEQGLNRVIVASCSPRTHEVLFQDTLRKAGLNKYLFEMANIRDQCSWVHQNEPDLATEKAKDLVRMAVARARRLEPLIEFPYAVIQKGLVIGGGAAGMTAALNLADQGFETFLVEQSDRLGGQALRLHHTLEEENVKDYLEGLIKKVSAHPRIQVFMQSKVLEIKGSVGQFGSTLLSEGKKTLIEHGVVLVATGGSEYRPKDYLFGRHPRVLTQLDFQGLLYGPSPEIRGAKQVAMIQCVGSREEDHPYCSRVCCSTAVANALKVKKISPRTDVVILYRDMRTYARKELFYKQAREAGVRFVRFDPEAKPEVAEDQGRLMVTVLDQNLKRVLRFRPDYLALSAAIRPAQEAKTLATTLKLPLDADGFFLEAHIKLRPLDFANAGMFLCGLGHGPKSLEESLVQAKGAAARAATILAQKEIQVGGKTAVVNEDLCVACLTCARVCPFGVPTINERHFAEMNPAACQGCGNCASACPQGAIQVGHAKDDQYMALLEAC